MNTDINVVKYLRQINGLSLGALGKETGLNAMDICRIENFNYNCHLGKLLELAKYFGVDIETLCYNKLDDVAESVNNPAAKTYEMQKRIHKQNLKKEKAGRRGEEFDYELEKYKLKGTIYENAIDPNYADKDDAHFDMLSFDVNGNPIIIEVKSTINAANSPFYMTRGELNKAIACYENGENYRIDRMFRINNKNKRGRKQITAEELFRDYDFIPQSYKVKRKGDK